MPRNARVGGWLALLVWGAIGLAPGLDAARAASEPPSAESDVLPFAARPRLTPPRLIAPPPGERAAAARLAGARAASAGLDGAWVELPPPARAGHVAIFDPLRHRIVVVAGSPDEPRRGVWVLGLDGAPHWDQLPVAGTPPPAIFDAAGAYDSVRDRILVWDSYNDSGHRGVYALALASMTWSELPVTGPVPTPRVGESLIYDPVRDRLLMFGGTDYNVSYQQVWSLSLGASPAWSLLAPTGGPPAARSDHVAIYDPVRDRLVVFGGYSAPDPDGVVVSLTDSWELSLSGGSAWSLIEPSGFLPLGTARAAAVYDPVRDRMVVYGGQWSNGAGGGITRALSALSFSPTPIWQSLTTVAPAGRPPFSEGNSAIYDPIGGRLLSFGGLDYSDYYAGPIPDAWAVTLGSSPTWSRVIPNVPTATGRIDRSVILDLARLRLVLFGGAESGGDFCCSAADIPIWTYSLPTAAWQTIDAGLTSPAKRYDHTAIYDPVRDRMLLFGGTGGPPDPSGELRVLDFGGAGGWVTVVPSGPQPPPRAQHSAILDPVRDRMIVFGGENSVTPAGRNDVWALGLASLHWEKLLPAGAAPSVRKGHIAIYDPAGDRMIVFGGASVGAPDRFNAWALNLGGSPVWTPLPPVPPPPYTHSRMLGIYDPLRQRLIVIGGLLDQAFQDEAWALNLVSPPAWTRLDIAGVAPALGYASAVYEALNDRVIVPDAQSSQLYALQFPPGGPTPTLVSLVSAEAGPNRARLVWQVAAGTAATVYRRTAESAWRDVGRVIADPAGRVTFEDAGLAAGTRYGYRLGLDGAGAGSAMGEAWIDIPAAPVFSLRGAVPNPSLHGLRIEFSLASDASARIDVLDIAGRRVASREVGALGPGAHALSLDESAGLRPGLYLLRLTQAGRSLTTRALVIP